MMRYTFLIGTLLLSACASHAKPQTHPTADPSPSQWSLPDSAKDSDVFCAPTFLDDGPYSFQVCRSVGEVRQFLRSKKA